MSRGSKFLVASVAVAVVTAAVVVAAPATQTFRAVPAVKVVAMGSATGSNSTLQLVNDTLDPVAVDAIVATQACTNIAVSPTTFVVAGSASQSVTLACASQPAGIHVCPYDVRTAGGDVLTRFEGACLKSGMPTLTPTPPSALDFGDVAIGNPETLPLVIRNSATVETVQRLDFLITDLENFEIGAPCNQAGHHCSANVTLGTAAMTMVDVRCTPKSTGMKTALLYIASDSLQQTPLPLTLTCNGTPGSMPAIAISPSVLDLGGVEAADGTRSGTIYISNVGTGTLTVTDVRAVDSGTGAALDWTFTASNRCPSVPPSCALAANEQLDLAVTFDPSRIAVRDATLLVSYHDIADRSISIPLRGLGTGVTLELVGPPMIDFGLVPVGITSTVTFQLANHGNRVLDEVAIAVAPTGPITAMPAATTVLHTAPRTITLACTPTQPGIAMAIVSASAPDIPDPPLALLVRCEGTDQALYARPSTIALGEVRLGTDPVSVAIELLSANMPLTISGSQLATASPNLTLGAVSSLTTPAMVQLTVAPTELGELATTIDLTANNGDELHVPVTGTVVSATVATPLVVALGTFCIDQSTTAATLDLRSTGTGTVRLPMAPALVGGTASPFELALAEPSSYPTSLATMATATVELAPKRQALASTQSDKLVWSTDILGQEAVETTVSARFIDDEGAIAPSSIAFGQVPASHLIPPNGRLVTIQNCGVVPLEITAIVPTPFTIEGAGLAAVLQPTETARLSVGFHPTRAGIYHDVLSIESNQLSTPLQVALSGEGLAGGGEGDADPDHRIDPTSFYACSCRTADPASALAIGFAILGALVPRRRRRPTC